MSAIHTTISNDQLRDVELALSGVWGGEVALDLVIDDVQPGAIIELHDAEGTGVALLSAVEAARVPPPTAVAERIGEGRAPTPPPVYAVRGPVAPARPLGHRDQLDLRLTVTPLYNPATILITGDVPPAEARAWTTVPVGSTIAVLDHGDSRALSDAVSTLRARRMEPVVMPAPSRIGRDHLEWLATVEVAAQHLLGGSVNMWVTPLSFSPGRVILLTGLSGSGKSTIAKLLVERLAEADQRTTTLLDGDEVRLILSSGLGFSLEDRMMNVRRIGWVAALVAKHGGIAVCAPIAPYDVMREEMRARAEECGRFLLVHIATPLEVCEKRDRKGLYAKARAGEIPQFTGISDPYEIPPRADLTIDASVVSPDDAVMQIIRTLKRLDAANA